MISRFLIRPEAQVDIEESALWYEDQKPELGELFTRELFERSTSSLKRMKS